uniref:SAM domain-containing protein n=1 Tax=Caenorhabditis japonica TaxID=281687 RepID=A0A8R1EPB6_CAEJA
MEHHRVSKKQRTRRAKEKINQAAWKKKPVKDWTLDDVLLWLQSAQMDEVASLLIGYELRGEDLLQWNDHTLAQLGVSSRETREQLLADLTKIIETGPEPVEEQGKVSSSNHRTLFDIVKQTSYDQVLAVETPLTTRDITVTHGRLGCLQITKVNGANLPLKEHDCLLEINERAGEQFKSALMLTKLISDSNGAPIRFVVLRRKSDTIIDETQKESSSSGISSSPQTPSE